MAAGEVMEFREDVVHLDSKTQPLIKFLPGELVLLSGADRTGVFVRFDGSPAGREPVRWRHKPEVIGASAVPGWPHGVPCGRPVWHRSGSVCV